MENKDKSNMEVAAFVSSLVFNVAIAGGLLLAFTILRHSDDSVYEPRTYMVEEEKRPPKLAKSPISWIVNVFRTKDKLLLRRVGLDAYMFLRFMRSSFFLFLIFSVFGYIILLPLNSVFPTNNLTELLKFGTGNVEETNRLWGHVVLNYLFTGLTLYMIYRDSQEYIHLRQRHLMSTEHQNNPMSSTILITGVPSESNNEMALKEMFSVFPNGVKYVCINRNVKNFGKEINKRSKILGKLESAETKFIKAGFKDSNKPPKRPTHRNGMLPCFGEKVDSIDHYRQELARLNQEIVLKQKDLDQFSIESSAFITFNNQLAAHLAVQSLAHNKPLAMEARYVEVDPRDVVWNNLSMFSIERSLRKIVSLAITIALVILWFIPSAFVQSIANIHTLAQYLTFLSAIDSWPASIVGIITGILPSVALAALMAILPMILRALIKFEGTVRHSDIEQSLMNKYFFFLVVNVFLVTLLTGPITGILKDKSRTLQSINENLPKASIFFITYVLLQAFVGASKEILQIVPLVLRYLKRFVFASTPRKLMDLENLPNFVWGTVFPQHTLIFLVGISFATIAPILLLFVAAYFGMYYLVYCHQFQYVYGSNSAQTGGLFYPHAVYHMFTGLYSFQVCVLIQYFIRQTYAQAIVQVVLLVITVCFNVLGVRGFSPLLKFLPLNIALDPRPLGLSQGNMALNNNTSPNMSPGDVDLEKQGFTDIDLNSSNGQRNNASFEDKNEADYYGKAPKTPSGNLPIPTVNIVSPKEQDKLDAPQSSANSESSNGQRRTYSYTAYSDAEKAYLHPALKEPVPIVWLPKDTTGLSDREVYDMEEQLLPATNEGAYLDEKGHIVLTKHDESPTVAQTL
ncbi:phosphate metabolism protein 7 [Basidiobolus ranarum]|uniref:Phosphate metabolism protein 7 n=1 Tax=Basidiobolus ranarum TaxID=34480 RepID=A0ABR2VVI3_9FUNG